MLNTDDDTATYIDYLEKEIERLRAVVKTSQSFDVAMSRWEQRHADGWSIAPGRECDPGLTPHKRAIEVVKREFVLAMWYAYDEGKSIGLIENAIQAAIKDAINAIPY